MDGMRSAARSMPLSRADAAWLRIEQAMNHFVVTALVRLDADGA